MILVEKEVFEFRDAEGFAYQLIKATNREERRVIFLFMQEPGARLWHPVIEMDIDIASYYKDVESDIDPPGTKDDDADNGPKR